MILVNFYSNAIIQNIIYHSVLPRNVKKQLIYCPLTLSSFEFDMDKIIF